MPAKSAKKMSGEVYYPFQDVIAQARLKDWDALAASADKDLEGFWAKEAEELEWFSNGTRFWTTRKSPSSNGSWGARSTSSTTR